MPSFTTTPADSGFIPRKEFIREQRTTTNTFCLLTISGSNAVRLYAFPPPMIAALRRLFDQNSLTTAFRQDVTLNLCEFSLDGRPWSNPKTVSSEKLLIDILAVIFQHGYLYLSTIDYGRERDDRIAIAFSKPSFLSDSSIRSGSPSTASPDPGRTGSPTSHLPTAQRVAFALSFTSATRLRVISPPLHSTPAILQAVRGSWPRGVVSEKKVAEATFEFKLKGYKWFHEDTFATDSLRQILSILSSLDTHSFSLLTSLSLSSRSRVKDLWIFAGPAPPSEQEIVILDSPPPSIFNSPNGEPRAAQGSSPEPSFNSQPPAQHRRYASAPTAQRHPNSPVSNLQHGRSATENVVSRGASPNIHGYVNTPDQDGAAPGSILRKAAPRAQVPVSVTRDLDDQGIRVTLPSTVSSDVENMTGIGAATSAASWRAQEPPQPQDIIYETSPETEGNSERSLYQMTPAPVDAADKPRSRSPPGRYRPLRPVSSRSKTPPLLKSNPLPSTATGHLPTSAPAQVETFPVTMQPQPQHGRSSSAGAIPLLGSGVFRDSALSSTSDASVEIPIKWTGGDVGEEGQDRRKRKSKSSPTVPGGWAPTPVQALPEEVQSTGNADVNNNDNGERAVQEVVSRVALPEVTPAERLIKSEVGSVGVIVQPKSHSPPPPPPPVPPTQSKGKGKESQSDGSMQGWVLVNVEGRKSPADNRGSPESVHPSGRSSSPRSPNGTASSSSKAQKKPSVEYSAMSTPAKAIAVIDGVDARSNTPKTKSGSNPSGFKRLFGLKKNTKEKENSQLMSRSGTREKMNTPGKKRLTID